MKGLEAESVWSCRSPTGAQGSECTAMFSPRSPVGEGITTPVSQPEVPRQPTGRSSALAGLQPGAGFATGQGLVDRDQDDCDGDADEEWNPGDPTVGIVVVEEVGDYPR